MLTCLDSTAGDLPNAVSDEIEWLIFTRSNVPVLKKQHLANFPSLTDLHLKETNLEKIEDDAFSGSKALAWVDVSLNKLTTINPNLFDGCTAMYYLNVSGNPNLVIPKNEPFLNAPQLKWLLIQNSGVKELYSETFSKLTGLKFLSLSDNELSTIPSDLFKPMKHLTSLDLSRNHFKTINIDMPTFRTLALYMSDNPWECDCKLFPTIEWSKNHRIKDEVRCMKPDDKKWQEITTMNCPMVS
ncbi:hypothetical protein RUM43_004960 [Polyplax serrata]|uniref:Uncharacterized protein n=1 Tax=Polyplax serrata TaxID=468196 RepID=A0AAN8SBG2_POLSC